GARNIALGYSAGFSLTTGSNNIDIGNLGVAAESNTIRVRTVGTQTNTYIAGISGVTVAGGVGVIIDTNGKLGTVVSSERYKEARIAQLRSTLAQQEKHFQKAIALQQKQIKAIARGLEDVNNQLEASKPARQVVANGQ